MADLVNWYNAAEQEGKLSPVELAALFHYRYILIHENVWWYDGERIAFRTPNYSKILNAMRTEPKLTLADMKELTTYGYQYCSHSEVLDQLILKKYVERGEKDGSWRVFVHLEHITRLAQKLYLPTQHLYNLHLQHFKH